MRRTLLAFGVLAALISLPAQAGLLGGKKKCELLATETDPAALTKIAKKCGFVATNRGIGKKTPVPKKVAIANFQVRYDKVSNTAVKKFYEPGSTTFKCNETQYRESGSTRIVKTERDCWADVKWGKTRREFSSADFVLEDKDIYQFLTNAMYDLYVEMLTRQGYEVVPMEDVKGADTYALLGGKLGSKEKRKLIRTSAYGLKNLSMQGMVAANKLPGLNKDLETHAVIDFFATIGLKLDKQDRLSMCLGSQNVGLGMGLNIELLAGYKELKTPSGKPRYQAKASATAGISNTNCLHFADGPESAMTYVKNSAHLVVGAAKMATVMLDQAFNK